MCIRDSKNTDEEAFLQLLKDYKARLDADKAENPNVMDRKMIDVVEAVRTLLHQYFYPS